MLSEWTSDALHDIILEPVFRCLYSFVIKIFNIHYMKEMLYAVRCLKSNEDMILALAGQFKQLSHEPEKFR